MLSPYNIDMLKLQNANTSRCMWPAAATKLYGKANSSNDSVNHTYCESIEVHATYCTQPQLNKFVLGNIQNKMLINLPHTKNFWKDHVRYMTISMQRKTEGILQSDNSYFKRFMYQFNFSHENLKNFSGSCQKYSHLLRAIFARTSNLLFNKLNILFSKTIFQED